MNWNSMCAECHNTRLRKNYDQTTDSYHTTMDEMSVSCGACHASLTEHLTWQKEHPGTKLKDPTLSHPTPARQLDTCGSCHARRENITGNFVPGDSFFDHYQLQILDDTDSWYADGQVHTEDYEFTSFLSSKMHDQGVTCMDCHNPHSGKVILAANDLCMRCHSGAFPKAPIIKPFEHSHHLTASAGNDCVGCHMPVTVYMQRHARRDHGFTIPDPLLTKELNIPNACNRCHTDKSVEWATKFTDEWYGQKMNRPTRGRARWIAAAQRGDINRQSPLIDLLSQTNFNAYWRAVDAGLLWQWPDDPKVKAALITSLHDNDPLVREQATKSLENFLGSDQNVAIALKPMLADPVRNVRVATAWTLRANLDASTLSGKELTAMLDFNADQPFGQYRKAMFEFDRGNATNTLRHLRTAEDWDPFSPPIRQKTADVLTLLGMTNEAAMERQILRHQNLKGEH
jgi:hypothetical protein